MITKIQGIFKPEILVDYKTIRSPGKNIGEQGNLTLKVWGIRYAGSARDYEKIANGLEYGTFENERFVVNEIETARAKNELKTLSPRVFAFGSELIIREVNGKGLDYQLMVGMIEVCERDYLVGPEAAWRFRRLALNDQRYNDEIFNRQVRKGEITWFKKAPSQEHLKKRKQEDYRTSATFWTADSERRVFRLVDLIQ